VAKTAIADLEVNADFLDKVNPELAIWLEENLRLLRSSLTLEDWIVPAFLNSWANYGSGFREVGYAKDFQGFVHLSGIMKDGSIGAFEAFILPEGYRPPATLLLPTVSWSGTGVISYVQIFTDGSVHARQGGNSWFSLEGLQFRTV